jgi:hypothetical protein
MIIRAFSRILVAGSVIVSVSQFATAQQPQPFNPIPQPGLRPGNDLSGRFDANRPMTGQAVGNDVLRGSQIIGATVDLRGGMRLGSVQDFVVGQGGCVDYVIAAYGDQFVPIPWGVAFFQPGQRLFTVDIDPGRIHEMPMYRQISELTNRQFSQRVQTFYHGVQGRQGDRDGRGSIDRQNMTNAPGAAPRGDHSGSVPQQGTQGKQRTQGTRPDRSERSGEHR